MASVYRPNIDFSAELGPDQSNYYQNLIGVLIWNIESGMIDIHNEVVLISRYLALLWRGHME